jgi:hypothetical protein
MRLIGAGLPRTATTTTLIAFEQLGFAPCYHMRDLLADLPGQLPLWERVAEGDPDWEAIFAKSESTCDFPGSAYYRELMDFYPDAKVLMSVRSAEGWLKSMLATIWPIFYGRSVMHYVNDARRVIDRDWDRYLTLMTHIWTKAGMTEDPDSEDALGKAMEKWNADVKAAVPADRLLVWEPADGWEPMCEFLDVPVPDGPLPNVNDTAAFQEGLLGGSLAVVNAWWDKRERPSGGLHGAPAPTD